MNDLIILKSYLIKYSMSVAALEVYPPRKRAVVLLQLLKAPTAYKGLDDILH